MHDTLVARMGDYLNAGLRIDVEELDRLYDADFENVRVDQAGRTVRLTKADFMSRFRSLRKEGELIGDSIEDASFPASTTFDDHAAVVMRRIKGDRPVFFIFIWRLVDGAPSTIIRELTFENDLGYLLRLLPN